MKRLERFINVHEIDHAIEECHAQAKKLLVEAEEKEGAAKRLSRFSEMREAAVMLNEEAKRLRTKASNLAARKAKALSEKKSEFLTVPMFEGMDPSVSSKITIRKNESSIRTNK